MKFKKNLVLLTVHDIFNLDAKILIWKVCYFLLFQVKFRKDENNKTFSSKQIEKSIKKALL